MRAQLLADGNLWLSPWGYTSKQQGENWRHAVFTPAPCREARKLLKWSHDRLAPRCGMSAGRVRLFETGQYDLPPAALASLQRALEEAGAEFTDGNHPDVRLKKRD